MPEPTRFVPTCRVVMRPVNHPALGVPFVDAIERHGIAHLNRIDPGREINVVCDEQRLTRGQPENEALMPAAFVVIRQQGDHFPLSHHLQTAALVAEGRLQCIDTLCLNVWRCGERSGVETRRHLLVTEIERCDDGQKEEKTLHGEQLS